MMAAQPYSPERSCVACRRKRPQAELLRFTRLGGAWQRQEKRRTGRGMYLCADCPSCWQEKKLRRAFAGQAPIIAEQLRQHHSGQAMSE